MTNRFEVKIEFTTKAKNFEEIEHYIDEWFKNPFIIRTYQSIQELDDNE